MKNSFMIWECKKSKAFERQNFLHDPGVARCLRYFIQIFSCLNNCFLSFGIPVAQDSSPMFTSQHSWCHSPSWPWSPPLVRTLSVMFVSSEPGLDCKEGWVRGGHKKSRSLLFVLVFYWCNHFTTGRPLIMAPMSQEIPSTCLNNWLAEFPILHNSQCSYLTDEVRGAVE